MAHPFDWAQKSNVVQLIVGTRSYSVRCNIQNSAERKVYYNEHGCISHTPPMSHSAFFPTALFMFQPLNKHVDLFFQRTTSVLFLWQLWKLEFWAPRPHLLLFAEARPKRVDVGMCLLAAWQLLARKGAEVPLYSISFFALKKRLK